MRVGGIVQGSGGTSSSLRRSKGLKGVTLQLGAASSDASLSSTSCSAACVDLSFCRCLAAMLGLRPVNASQQS